MLLGRNWLANAMQESQGMLAGWSECNLRLQASPFMRAVAAVSNAVHACACAFPHEILRPMTIDVKTSARLGFN
jgi:hypothetical protein